MIYYFRVKFYTERFRKNICQKNVWKNSLDSSLISKARESPSIEKDVVCGFFAPLFSNHSHRRQNNSGGSLNRSPINYLGRCKGICCFPRLIEPATSSRHADVKRRRMTSTRRRSRAPESK